MKISDFCENASCTGCMACYNACHHRAIEIVNDEEGFQRPVINQDICVDCKLCSVVCPISSPHVLREPLKVYSGWSGNEQVRPKSSSGGAFTEIAEAVLRNGGVVFGCAMNESLQAQHTYIERAEDLWKLRGSKYSQSIIGTSYQQAKSFLKEGRQVLFSGTSCQIAGLRNFLRREYENLVTVDLICHGVPSPMMFEEYKRYLERTENMKIDQIFFRCKNASWRFYNMTVYGHVEKTAAQKTYTGRYLEDPWIRGFLRDYFLRPSCHQCRFTSTSRVSDFTIADWWSYRATTKADRGFNYKGVSLILVNSERAKSIIANAHLVIKERTIAEAMRTNKSLSMPYKESPLRNDFWKDYRTLPFDEMVHKYMSPDKLTWDNKVLMRYKNTDLLVFSCRVLRKLMKIMNLAK